MSASVIEEQMAFQLTTVLGAVGVVREHRFHPERRWRFDFAWPDLKVALEIEGGTFMRKGGHTTGVGYYGDAQKYNEAALLGWLVLRVTPHMVRDGQALTFVERALVVRS